MKITERINKFSPANFIKINTNKKEFFSSVAFLFIMYALAMSSIIRANFSYIDDLGRSIDGYELGGVFSRHISNFLGFFLHAGNRITDISPLPQLVACLIMALTGFVLVKIICNKPNYLLLFASLPIGLSPYFLECFSYKFDAPYMALSILASIFPFLYRNKNRCFFAFVCIVSTLVMTMTYQAASGIFIMMTLYIFFTNLIYKKTTTKNNFIFLGISFTSYCAAILMYRFCFMEPIDFGYVSTELPKFGDLISVFQRNVKIYYRDINNDFHLSWIILIYVLMLIYYIKTIVLSKINKILTVFLTLIFFVLLFLSAFGLYLILADPYFGARAMYGFGAFIAILCVDICFSTKKIFAVPVIALIWCFFVFYFTYGNALADQKRYNNFRTELILKDLSSILPEKTGENYAIKIMNNAGHSPVVEHATIDYPLIKKLVPSNLKGGWSWGYVYLTKYFKFPLIWDNNIIVEEIPVVFDSYYHTIKYEKNQIVVILK